MEGISTRLDTVGETEPPPEESVDPEAVRFSQAWDFDGSSMPALLMERLATIPEVASTEEDTAPTVTAPPWSVFAPPVSLPVMGLQGSPSVNAPSSSTTQSRPMGIPKAPYTTQSGVGNAAFKEYVEQTIAMMRAPPQQPPIERSCTATPSIPIQTMTLGTATDTGPALEATATSAPAVPQEARIGGLKLEMPEKYTGSRTPAVSGWLTKMERYFRLMKYPTDIWVDVIATRITDAAQAWLDKELQDLQLGRCLPWASWAEFCREMEQAFTPLSEVEHARRKLMEMKMGKNVSTYIQAFRTQMYKVPEMTQEEAFSLFMRGLEPRIREQIGYHVEGDLGWAMAMAEKANVWRSRGEGQNQKGQNKPKAGGSGQSGSGQNPKGNKKPWWGKKGSGNAVQGKGTVTTEGASSSGSVAAVASGTNTQGHQNQQKKGPRRKFPCPGCGGKHQFKDCPQWKSVQALLAKEKKLGKLSARPSSPIWCGNRDPELSWVDAKKVEKIQKGSNLITDGTTQKNDYFIKEKEVKCPISVSRSGITEPSQITGESLRQALNPKEQVGKVEPGSGCGLPTSECYICTIASSNSRRFDRGDNHKTYRASGGYTRGS